MATLRQKKLANALVNNLKAKKPVNKQTLVASVGYSEMSADKKATEIIDSKGVQETLKSLGFHSDNAKRVIGQILNKEYAEDKDRLKAGELVLKVNGDFAPEKNITLSVSTDELKEAIQNDLLKFRPH